MWYIIIAAVFIASGILSFIYVDPLGIVGGSLIFLALLVLIVGATRYLWKNKNILKR